MPEPTIELGRSSERGYPYRYGHQELEFEIKSFTIDGGEDSGTPRGSSRTVELFRYGEWETATVEGTIGLNQQTVDYVFHESERENDFEAPGKIVIASDCEATQERRIVEEFPLQGECSFTQTIDRSNFRDFIELTPAIVRTDSSEVGLPYAPSTDLRIADGPTWAVLIDEPTERGSGFPTRYLDFSDSNLSTNLVHVLNDNPADPRILVNEDIQALVEVLESGGHTGFRPRLRDVLRREIVMMTLLQLIWYTWGTIAETGSCEYDWQRGLLDELSEYLFEEELDQDEVVEEFGQMLDNSSDIRAFVRELNEAVQLYVEHRQHLEVFIEEEAP